jgi:hypothetical protein
MVPDHSIHARWAAAERRTGKRKARELFTPKSYTFWCEQRGVNVTFAVKTTHESERRARLPLFWFTPLIYSQHFPRASFWPRKPRAAFLENVHPE